MNVPHHVRRFAERPHIVRREFLPAEEWNRKTLSSLQSPVEHFLISMLWRGRLSFPVTRSFAQLVVGFLIATDIRIQSVARVNNYGRQQLITTAGFNHPTLAQRPTVVRVVTVVDHRRTDLDFFRNNLDGLYPEAGFKYTFC